MATLSLPSTPGAKAQASAVGDAKAPPSPGTWRHPQLDEIVRRQNAATFGDANLRKVKWNGGALVASWFFGSTFTSNLRSLSATLEVALYPRLVLWLIRFVLLFNVVVAFSPLYRRSDDLSDIPLTPSQRALFGLDPASTAPVTPDTQYKTPPRYRRSSGSLSATPSSRGTPFSSSPLAGKGSSNTKNGRNGSSFSPSASPLFQRAIGGSPRDTTRRHSYGSPLTQSPSVKEGSTFRLHGSPNPVGGKGASVGLNYKYLYDSGRGLPRSESIL